MTTIDLHRLAADLETATPHQTPTWADGIPAPTLRRLLTRAEQLANHDRTVRIQMRQG